VLVLTRKIDEAILIGEDIKITLLHVESVRVRIGIEAPRHLRIFRYETMKKIMLENQLAAGENVNLVALSHLKEEASKNE
jgi:carbon storage regulator